MPSSACRRIREFSGCLVAAVVLWGLAGCGDAVTPVSGTVKYKGLAVKGGTLTFSPADDKARAKSASGKIQDDGTYQLGTHAEKDGAVVGKHKVTFLPAEPEVTEEQRKDPKFQGKPSLYSGLVPKTAEVEVKSGPNTIDIELIVDPTPKKN
jgi:hypothetical protein